MSQSKGRTIAFWVLTGLTGLGFLAAGAANLAGAERQVEIVVNHLGYPAYLLTILGIAKVAGGIVVLAPGLPRLKEWAYAGIAIDLIGAALSHLLYGDGAGAIGPPLGFLAVALGSYALRPPSRRLAG